MASKLPPDEQQQKQQVAGKLDDHRLQNRHPAVPPLLLTESPRNADVIIHHTILPDIPEDMFLIDGFQGQRVFVVPSKKLVVVRLGYSMKNFDMNEFLEDIISTLPV